MREKVVHCTTVHSPLDVRIFEKECRTLAAAGYRVVVIGPHEKDAVVDGIRVRALPKPGSRWSRLTVTVARAYRACVDENAEVYHVHDPELLPLAPLLRLRGAQVIYDVHEDLPRQLLSKPWIPRWLRPVAAVSAELVERAAWWWVNAFVAATPAISRRFPKRRTVVVRNFPIREELFPSGQIQPYSRRRPWVVYAGGLTNIRGVREMVKAIEVVSDSAVRLQLAGAFESAEFEREVRALRGWQRVDFLGWVPRATVTALLSAAKVGLVVFHPEPNHLEAQPTKLFEYMAAGLPVIASDFPLWRRIVEGAGCGLLVDPLDPLAIGKAIDYLCAHPEEAQGMGKRGRRAVEERYNWASEGEALARMYRGLLP